jgi:hypothetical protein
VAQSSTGSHPQAVATESASAAFSSGQTERKSRARRAMIVVSKGSVTVQAGLERPYTRSALHRRSRTGYEPGRRSRRRWASRGQAMYKHAGRFLQALVRRGDQPPRRTRWTPRGRADSPKADYDARKAQSGLVKRLDKEVDKVVARAKGHYEEPKAQSGLVKRRRENIEPLK